MKRVANERSLIYCFSLLPLLLLICTTAKVSSEEVEQYSCGWEDRDSCTASYKDPNLYPMKFNLGDVNNNEEQTFDVFIEPDVATYYNRSPGSLPKVEPKIRGMFGKFINQSPNIMKIYWYANQHDTTIKPIFIADVEPFGATGTATIPGHIFVITNYQPPTKILRKFVIKEGNSIYTYDPFKSIDEARSNLSDSQLEQYLLQYKNLAFNKVYERATNRQWLGLYGRKHAPRFPIWPADSIGQTHTVTTDALLFTSLPPNDIAKEAVSAYGTTRQDREFIRKYQSSESTTLNLTITALSVSPRVFEIKNFLSDVEVYHILELATNIKLSRSTTQAGDSAQQTKDSVTRTSFNSWLARNRSIILDIIHRRIADLLNIDEALLRHRHGNETKLLEESNNAICERLQLLRYAEGEEYTAHHDFNIPDPKGDQQSRFATVLFYLNEGMEGGETSFPNWKNAVTSNSLSVKPEMGKAILFYNQLPDGNYDERSLHAAMPVIKGEKWLINLWVWEPYFV